MPIHRKPRALALAATNGRDTLDATADGQTLHGLGGRDLLRSTFNQTSLFGDGGNDRLTVELERSETAVPVTLSSTLSGGTGKDTLELSYDGRSTENTTMDADLEGGAGRDTITVDVKAAGFVATSVVRVQGGADSDYIVVRGEAFGLDGPSPTEVINRIDCGDGDDVIDAVATAENPGDARATNVIFGGNGNDRITARTNDGKYSGVGLDYYATNEISGGAGHDYIEAFARVNANNGRHSLNSIMGGAGNDTIVASAVASSNSTAEVAENRIAGETGNDSITVYTGAAFGHGTLRGSVTGDAGHDRIVSTANGGTGGIDARLAFDGGIGNDRIESTVEMDGSNLYGPDRILNRLEGHDGNDTLVARIETIAADGSYTPNVSSVNRLEGGAGTDVLEATVVNTGRSILHGGSGADILKVEGGQSNLLSGGSGADRFFTGSGSDRMIGGGGADDFIFDVTEDQGTTRILDFDGDLDRLCFIGLTDTGARGLADDLDAISTVVDEGAGLDVVVSLDSGTVLTFEGCGRGDVFTLPESTPIIDSLADLVETARTQLVVEPL
jgi:Ca2+-binding RTX toxin-like protein